MGEAIATPMLNRNHAAIHQRSRSIDLRVFMVDKYMEPKLIDVDIRHTLQATNGSKSCPPAYHYGSRVLRRTTTPDQRAMIYVSPAYSMRCATQPGCHPLEPDACAAQGWESSHCSNPFHF